MPAIVSSFIWVRVSLIPTVQETERALFERRPSRQHVRFADLDIDWQVMSAIPDFIYPDTIGERTPDLPDHLNFQRALGRLAVLDAEIYELLVEIFPL